MQTSSLVTAANNLLTHLRDSATCERKRAGCGSNAAALDAAAAALEAQVQRVTEQRSRPGMVRSILVAVDDSEPAQWAVDEAVRLAEELDARVSLIHVVDVAQPLAPEFAFDDAFGRPALVLESKALLKGLAGLVPEELRGEQLVREGKADKEIVLAAQEIHTDLLVVGTHGRGALGRFLLGSVAEAVVRHAICPVLTVSHPRKGVAPEPYTVQTVKLAPGGALAK